MKAVVNDWEQKLADYPIVNDENFTKEEQLEANEVWLNCYTVSERVYYIRQNRSQFEFHSFADLMCCVRGEYFIGDTTELLS
jgi:hypothetical protein